MNLVDSSAWLEYFDDGPNAEHFAPAIERLDALLVPSICLLEVFKVVLRQRDESDALTAVANMRRGAVVDLTPEIALVAGRWGLEHKLPLADSVILATARLHDAIIWTQDADFAHLSNVQYRAKQ